MADVLDFIYILMSLGISVGAAFCIVAKVISRSNNIGDSCNTLDFHVRKLIDKDAAHTYNDYTEGMTFIHAYGEAPEDYTSL